MGSLGLESLAEPENVALTLGPGHIGGSGRVFRGF